MSGRPDVDILDDDGYPTDEALVGVSSFQGTAADFVSYISELYLAQGYGKAVMKDVVDYFGRDCKEVTLVTGGWSGCEDVLEQVRGTFFHITFWAASFRGGKDVYLVPEGMWDVEMMWGNLKNLIVPLSDEVSGSI